MWDNNNKITFADTSVAFCYKDDKALRKSYVLFSSVNNRHFVKFGANMVKIALKMKIPIEGFIKKTAFGQFCGGERIYECEERIKMLSEYGIGTILDFALEGADDEESLDRTTEEVLKTVKRAKGDKNIPFSVFKPTGLASKDLLTKIQSGVKLTLEEIDAFDKVKNRFYRIGKAAYENNVRLFIDSEDSYIQEPIDDLVYAMMLEFNKKSAIIFNTYQLYRKGMKEQIVRAIETARSHGYFFGAKLVRGAYMEKERERALRMGYADPILPDKNATDQQYNETLKLCVDNIDVVSVCNASHNEESNMYLTELMRSAGLKNNDERIYFAQLFGMGDHISFNLAKHDYNVAKYLPFGPVEALVPYLIRRAEENSSMTGQTSRELKLISEELKRRKAQSIS